MIEQTSVSGLAFILAFLMAVIHFMGEGLEEYIRAYREGIVSFSAGVSITYIFVQLLPEFYRIVSESGELIFIFPLIGFSSIHLLEKFVAKSGLDQERMQEDYAEIHSAFLFIYYGAIGYLIATLLGSSTASGLLFFLPIILHVAVSSLSLTELHESFAEILPVKLAVSVAPLLGVTVFNLNLISEQLFNPIFGTVIGMFFYVVIRDSIPKEDRGKPKEYLIGILLFLAIILAANTI